MRIEHARGTRQQRAPHSVRLFVVKRASPDTIKADKVCITPVGIPSKVVSNFPNPNPETI